MAGHAILPGCQHEWHHDCAGSRDMPSNPRGTPPEEIRTGGVICSCPCHPLQRAVTKLTEEGNRVVVELAQARRHLQTWRDGYQQTVDGARDEIARLTAELENARDLVDSLERNLNAAGADLDRQKIALSAYVAKNGVLERALAQVKAERDEAHEHRVEVVNKNAQLLGEIDDLRDQLRSAWLGNDD